ncbi:MAG: amidohydrolase family protein [Candidatus Bathyarchaeia archaeon]
MIFDAHTHIGGCDPFHHSNLERDLAVTAFHLIKEMDQNNVSRAIVMPNYRLPHRLEMANIELLSLIKPHKGRLIAFAWLDPRIEGCGDQLEHLVKRHGFKGLKLHPVLGGYYISNRTVHNLVERAVKLRIPIMVHTGWGVLGRPSYVGWLAESFPEARFIIAHMIDSECLDVARRSENIYLETSYSQHPRMIAKATVELGPDRLLYGSDYPLGGGMSFELSKVTLAEIGDEEKAMILGLNTSRLIEA